MKTVQAREKTMKKYSRKHICEAIAYWKKQLKQLNESNLSKDILKKIEDFKLEGRNAKWFTYGPEQKKFLKDLVKYCNDNPEVSFTDASRGESPAFRGLDPCSFGSVMLYKNDPRHVPEDEWNDDVKRLTRVFGQICKKPLYRGVSKAELQSILKRVDAGETQFTRDRSTSFTTNFDHAEKFSIYGGGSVIDEINRRDKGIIREAGGVLTVHCSKPLLFIDELEFFIAMSIDILGYLDDIKRSDAQDDPPEGFLWSEEEWIMPADMEWKLIDKDKLIFKA